ncbi:DUF1549 domain-containing protein [Arenibacter certesii]|uniref:DUF1549 domain-containing protein n=3 Tax=Arenibacter certesii TaxID=228955 RepID=A0A918J1I3_9FLAO|nr:DUF1549 domain-containing protein [Arenibacter certesii]GGW42182.1 hypothetical protein GCM10007383_28620 [Arenibacter certesii]
MKQKILIISILVVLLGVLYAFTSGAFHVSKDDYSSLKLPEVVDYNFHIKPILSDNCYTCHGPDANKRQGFRLDLEETAFSELSESPGEFPIVSKDPKKSKVYQAIVSDDPDMQMPPPNSNLSLNSYEKKLIKKWIEQGAKFEKHWAYLPPEKDAAPKTERTDWTQNEIDGFVLKKLEENNLQPSEKAPVETLIRRISLDLTGLPPTTEQVEMLLKDSSEENISKIIDEFLASPAYGERMAQSWLDVARYADSHGYQDDSYRTMWPWRDWVDYLLNLGLIFSSHFFRKPSYFDFHF